MAKRGRKRKGYFYEEQEQAVVDYNNAETIAEKERIFNTWLLPAFTKMVESIIRRYKLAPPDEEFDQTFSDTMAFLMTKLDHFNPNKGTKAYSYYGTICKRFLIQKIETFTKKQTREKPYEDTYTAFRNDTRYLSDSFVEEDEKEFMETLIENMILEIERMLQNSEELHLTNNEILVGKALVDLFQNWSDMFDEVGSNKLNKSTLLLRLKEYTRLSTQDIRNGLRIYKNAYFKVKKALID